MKNFCVTNSELTEKTELKKMQSWRNELRVPGPSRTGGSGVAELFRQAQGPELVEGLRPPEQGNRRGGLEAAAPCDKPYRGWILYDGQCPSCTASARHFDRTFRGRGFLSLPLQTSWVTKRLGLNPNAPLEEMHVLTVDGRDIAGADAVIFLARQVWWTWPIVALARLPGIHALLDRGYRWVAAHRGCGHVACHVGKRRLRRRLVRSATRKAPLLEAVWKRRLLEVFPAWIALIGLPISVLPLRDHLAPWQFMWLMAGAIFFGCKWLSAWREQMRHSEIKVSRAFAYFFAWPGMDAEKFLSPSRQNLTALSSQVFDNAGWEEGPRGGMAQRRDELPLVPDAPKRVAPTAKMLLGALLLFGIARFAPWALLAGWIGMVGMILILHFGLFQLLATGWRKTGIDVGPIMNAPLRSRSLSEFWGRRWNSAFNGLAFKFVFRPIVRLDLHHGAQAALLAAFALSGAIHELVISLPAGAGYGLPIGYFILQGIGILVERSLPQIRGRIFTVFITAVPAFWLFHPPFVHKVILPFMKAIGAL